MTQLPFYLLAFVVVLGVLIVVHEFGHYLAARYCGVRVLRFSVGFGRTLWQRRLGKDGTEWAISVFPLGGYVKMLDEREGEVAPEERERAFNRQSVGKRSLIVAAGPFANFALAILLYWIVFMMGSNELLPILERHQRRRLQPLRGLSTANRCATWTAAGGDLGRSALDLAAQGGRPRNSRTRGDQRAP